MDLASGFRIGAIEVEPRNGRLLRDGETVELEPKVMDLLCLLARAEGDAVSRDTIASELWAGRIVNDDALARTVWKLRQALADDARQPRLIATVPKRGYRLLVTPEPLLATGYADEPSITRRAPVIGVIAAGVAIVLAGAVWMSMRLTPDTSGEVLTLIERGDDFYAQMTQAENESAMRLYERALEADPDAAPAHAGLANALTQSVIRWSPGEWPEIGETSRVQTALANGRTQTETARRQLERALRHARRALEIDPGYALGYRALGLALSASGEIEEAIEAYNRAVTIEPDSWEALINLSDMHEYRGEDELSLRYLEQAFDAMSRVYDEQAVRIRPWYSLTGISIAQDHLEAGRPDEAERWYRRVLHWDPFNPQAVTGLAGLLLARGDRIGAREACAVLPDEQDEEACLNP